ncbi:MAG: glutathione S-transferase N-terminal domain-containing protein [Gammaproteobacteria bacterium]
MMELFFFPSPNGIKIAIMLEECELPYRVTAVDITAGDQFHPDYSALNPNNKIPALIDHDADGSPVRLFESGAILLYLAARSRRFFPAPDTNDYYESLPWLFWQTSHLGPMAGQAHYFRKFSEARDGHAEERFTNEMDRLYGVLETRLQNRDWLLDDYSIVDMACWPWVYHHEWQGQDLADLPAVKAWFDRMAARPAVQRAREMGLAVKVDRDSYRNVLHNQTRERAEQLTRSANEIKE